MDLLLQPQSFTMLCLCFKGALQHNDRTELVQNSIVLATICMLNTTRAAACRLASAALYQLKGFLQQDREQWSSLQFIVFMSRTGSWR